MFDYHSIKVQKIIVRGYFSLVLLALLLFMFFADPLYVNSSFKNSYNFIRKIDASGFLIFAGVASAVIYINASLFNYKLLAFMTGFIFAIAQSLIAASDPIVVLHFNPNLAQVVLMSAVIVCGAGVLIFSFLAVAVVGYDLKSLSDINKNGISENVNSAENVINPNPSVKNDSEQPSPAHADLAHDLRYSRSRARRSRAQR